MADPFAQALAAHFTLVVDGLPDAVLGDSRMLKAFFGGFVSNAVLDKCVAADGSAFVQFRDPRVTALVARLVAGASNDVDGKTVQTSWLRDDLVDARVDAAQRKAAAARAAPENATSFALPCCVLENLFDRHEEAANSPDWATEIRDDVASQVGKLAPQRIVVDHWTDHGRVYLQFSSDAAATECVRLLKGRMFAGRSIRAHSITQAQMDRAIEPAPK